jgi:hypothetical protein
MRAILRSLVTIALATTLPALVLGRPGGDVQCSAEDGTLLNQVFRCNNDVPDSGSGACVLSGHPNCSYDVTFVNTDGDVEMHRYLLGSNGFLTLPSCKRIQRKPCVICTNGSCPDKE